MRASPLILAACLAGGPAVAQEPRADRYELKPAENGFLRLDRESGATAFCAPAGDGYACRTTGDAPAATPGEIEALKSRVAALEETVRKLGSSAPPSSPKDLPSAADGDQSLKMPDEADVDRALSFVERAVRRFKRFAEEMERAAPPESERL